MSGTPDLQAADWFARWQSGDLSDAERNAFGHWVEAPQNAVAFARVEFTWERARRLDPSAGRALERRVARPEPVYRTRHARRRRRFGSIAAVIAVLVGVGGPVWFHLQDRGLYTTVVAERRAIELADGSRVTLNTGSRVRVSSDGHARRVRLERGEALFDVAHDPDRPFVVQTNGTEVRAVGTAFNVRLRSQVVEVTVTDGKVRLKAGDSASNGSRRQGGAPTPPTVGSGRGPATGPHEALLAAGQAAVVAAGVIETVVLDEDAVRRRVAWLDGVIELQGETLAQAVEEFNRYTDSTLVIADPRLASIRVGGRFRTDETDRFVSALKAQFSVRAVQGSGGEIYLLLAE